MVRWQQKIIHFLDSSGKTLFWQTFHLCPTSNFNIKIFDTKDASDQYLYFHYHAMGLHESCQNRHLKLGFKEYLTAVRWWQKIVKFRTSLAMDQVLSSRSNTSTDSSQLSPLHPHLSRLTSQDNFCGSFCVYVTYNSGSNFGLTLQNFAVTLPDITSNSIFRQNLVKFST